MRTVLNLLWLVFSGLWLAIGYVLAGLVLCLLIITIPFGVACFRLAAFVLWPFGRAVVPNPDAGAPSMVANVLWFVLAGVWMALSHLILGVLLCLTIIGIPLGLGNFKLAAVAHGSVGQGDRPDERPACPGGGHRLLSVHPAAAGRAGHGVSRPGPRRGSGGPGPRPPCRRSACRPARSIPAPFPAGAPGRGG